MVFQRLFKAIILHLWSFFGCPDGWGLRPFKSGNPLTVSPIKMAAAPDMWGNPFRTRFEVLRTMPQPKIPRGQVF